jgi:tetratricopeptide (TPR) repeat protein
MPDKINEWKEHSPDSYLPDLSLALYHNKMGWESRGQKVIDETTKKQVDKMQFHFNIAKLNFNRALNKKPDLLHAYAYLLNIAMTSSNNTQANGYYERGLEINMYSKRMHLFYSFALQPRWGGSMEQLEKFSEIMAMLSKDHPQLKSLIGVVDTETGDKLFYSGKPAEALLHYLKAEKNGATWYLNMNMGDAYVKTGDYDAAKTHYQKLISLRPMYAPAYYKLSYALMLQGHHKEAMDAGKIALDINPAKYDYITMQAQLYFNLDDYDNALKYVTIARQLNPDDTRLAMFTSIIEEKQKNTDN